MENSKISSPTFYKWEEVEELPDLLDAKTVYIVGENGYKWYVALLCPCNCSEIIYLNLLRERHPCWEVKIKKALISIVPSVWRTQNCKSHFVINKGNVIWYRNRRYRLFSTGPTESE